MTRPGSGGPSGDPPAVSEVPGGTVRPGRQLPERLVADRERAGLGGRGELAGDEDVVVAEHRVHRRAGARG